MSGFLQTAVLYVLPYILVLGLVVTIHELGHFTAAKCFGTAIDRFSIGFGRAIVSWRDRSGVEWRIGWMPLGGYVRFAGDENVASVPDSDDLEALRRDVVALEGEGAVRRYFHFKPIWQRAIIAAAGPAANFLLAIALFTGFLMVFGANILPARVASVQAGSVAAAAGIRAGDLIVSANGHKIKDFADLQEIVQLRANVPVQLGVKRGAQDLQFTATPRLELRRDPIVGAQWIGVLGVTPAQAREDYIRTRYTPVQALVGGTKRTWDVLSTTVYYIGRMVRGEVSADSLRGPLGIATVTGKVAMLGAQGAASFPAMLLAVGVNLVQVAALVSVSLGFINLMPLPVLDGGHLLFYAYEAVARRPLAAKVQAVGYRVGLALVLGLMLFATVNDLQRLRVFNFIGGLFS
ncbi:MAG: RIP metalloprotease RseP [Caulobacterales bacterium]|jgi:regulator of sigma E protease